MKKALTFILTVLILFSSCSPDTTKEKLYGSLRVSTETGKERTVEPSYSERHPVSYSIHVDSTALGYSEVFTASDGTYTINQLETGDYTVYVEGLNSRGSAIVRSEEQTLTIVNQKTTSAIFRLNRYTEGTGTLSFTVSVPKNEDSVDGVLFSIFLTSDTNLENSAQKIVTDGVESEDGKYRSYTLTETLDSGSYNFSASMFSLNEDGSRTQVGFTHIDAVHIYGGLTSSSTLVWDKEFFPAVAAPVIDTESGVYKDSQKIRITCSDTRATIYYTLDGTEPTEESSIYVSPIEIEGNTKLRAVSRVDGLVDSPVVAEDYTVYVENPEFSLPDNSMVDGDTLSITTATAGATIIYTTDGTEPTLDNGKEYTKPFTIRTSMTVKARAFKDGYEPSSLVSASYYDVNTTTEDSFFTITSKGAVSVNSDKEDEIPSVLVIPSTINGIDVVEIAANGFRNITSIEYLSIPSSVVTISNNAFAGCTNIKSVTISEYVTTLSATAFSGWTVDQRINDYSGLIKAGTLTNCQAKIYATVKPGTQTISGYTGMDTLYGITLSNNVTAIADNAFSGCVNLGEFTLPSYVTAIGSLAFNDCTKIESITLPNVLKTVASDAFKGWTNEQKIVDNSGLAITNGEFSDSSAKVYTTTPTTMTEIATDTIRNRDDIYGVEIKAAVKTIGDYAFEGTSIESIVIPDTVETIGLEVFKGWTDDQKVAVVYNGYTPSVSTDGTETSFTDTNAVYSVSFSNGITEIQNNAFNGMTSLSSITLPDTLTIVGANAFKSTALRTVTFGKNTKHIGDYAFQNCEMLESVTFNDGLETICTGTFENCSKLSSVTIHSAVTAIGNKAFYKSALRSVTFEDSPVTIGEEVFSECSTLETVNLGNGVISVGRRAFYNDDSLKTVTFGSSSSTIAIEAFSDCAALETVNLGTGVTSIGYRTFYNDDSLVSITIPDSVTAIGDELLSDCNSLETVSLGTGITYIPKKTFYRSNSITSITAPSCMGSLTITVKVPLTQLIVHDIAITVTPAYSSVYSYNHEFSRDNAVIDGDYRVFTYTIDLMLGLYYNIDVNLADYENTEVGSKTISDVEITSDTTVNKELIFTISNLTPRTMASSTITPSGGTYLDGDEITITNADADAIYYTTDGTTPTEFNGTRYTEPIIFHGLTNIKTIGVKEGYAYSSVASTSYSGIKAKAPTFDFNLTPVYKSTQYLEFATETEGASIYYSDSSSSTNWILYEGPIAVSSTKTIKAKSTKDGFADSDVTTADIKVVIPTQSVVTPTVETLSICWTKSGTSYIFTPVMSFSEMGATYEWYLDGNLVSSSSLWTTTDDLKSDIHYVELKVKTETASYSAELFTDELEFTYRVDLNSQWVKDTGYTNPDSTLYDGVYKSNSNYNVASSTATMYVYVKGCGDFNIYVRSYAQTTYDYVKVYELDSTSTLKTSTSGKQTSSKTISGYTKVTFSIPADGKEHSIQISYIKNVSTNSNEDRGFVLIPMNQ